MSFLVTLPTELYPTEVAGWDQESLTPDTARAAMWLAQLAYEDQTPKIEQVAGCWGLTLLDRQGAGPLGALLQSGARWIALEGHGRRFLAFSGTDPLLLSDWKTDLNIPRNEDDIHSGFAEGLELARDALGTALGDAADAQKVWIVGHSLGAALAVLAARQSDMDGRSPTAVYAFGMPRVGGERFAAQYETALGSRTYRFVHGHDAVPTIPPSAIGYRHVGRRIACLSGRAFDVSTVARAADNEPPIDVGLHLGEIVDVVRGVFSGAARGGRTDLFGLASQILPRALADHLPDRYWTALPSG